MDQSVAKGYIELDISNMKTAVASAVSELNKIDKAGDLAQSELNKLKSVSSGVGNAFQQAAEKTKVLSQGIEQAKSKSSVYKQEIDSLNKIIERSKEAQGQLATKIQDATGKYDKSQEKVKSLSQAYSAAQKEIKAVTKEFGENSTQAQEVATKNKSVTDAYEKAASSSQKYRNELLQLEGNQKALGLEIEDSAQSVVEFKTKLNNTEASINQMSKELAEASSKAVQYGQAMQSAGDTLQQWGNGINGVGNKLTLGVTTPLVAAGTASVKFASDSETSFAKVSTIADNTVLSYDKLKIGVTKASKDSGVAITDFNEALYQSLSAGIETGNAIGFTTDMVKLARGGFTDTAKAVDVVTSVLNAYGMSADQASSVSDKLVLTQKIGKTTVDELASSLGRIIPSAKAVNFDIDNVSTGMAILTKRGIQTAEATTYFNGMLNELGKSGTVADKALREMSGKGFSQMMQEGIPLTEVLQMLSDKAAENGMSLSDMFGSMEAGKAALSIMTDGGTEYNKVLEQMKNSTGEAQKAFDKMDATPAVKMEKELNKLKIAGIDAGEKLIPVVIEGAKAVGDLAQKFSSLSPETQKNIIKMLAFSAALGPVLKVVGITATGVGGLTKGFGKLFETFGKTSASKAAADGMEGVAGAATKAGSSTGILSKVMAGLSTPLGVVTLAIGGTAAVMALINAETERSIEKYAALTPAEQELSDVINEQYTAYKTRKEAQEESLAGIDAETERTQNLYSELKNLVDENGNIIAGNEDRAKFIMNELSQALGIEFQLTDNQIENYKELGGQIDSIIQKHKAEAIAAAMQDGYVEAYQNKENALKTYSDAQKAVETTSGKLKTAQEELDAVNRAYGDGVGLTGASLSIYEEKQQKALEKVAGLEEKLKSQTSELNKQEQAYIDCNQTVQNYEGLQSAIISGDAAKIEEALGKITNSFITAETGTRESLGKQVESLTEKYKEMQEAVNSGAPGVTQAAVDAMGKLVEQANAELNTKTEEGKTALVNKFKEIGIEAPQGIINGLNEKSPEAQGALLEMLSILASDTSLKKEELKLLLNNLGMESADSLSYALEGKKPSVQTKSLELLSQLQTAETAKRPEIFKQLNDLGVGIDDSLGVGITGNVEAVTGAMDTSVGQGFNAANAKIGKEKPNFLSNMYRTGVDGNVSMGNGLIVSDLTPPDVSSIDGKTPAKNARTDMQGYFNNNPLSISVRPIVGGLSKIASGVASVVRGYANGGVATQASIFAEDGPEMAIPLSMSKRSRAVDLYNQTGKLLGISPEETEMRTEMLNTLATSRRSVEKDDLNFQISTPEIDYTKLAKSIAEELRNVPIRCDAIIQMEDGDVYLDNERVGRKQAPVISRILSRS